MNISVGLMRSTGAPDEGRRRRKHRAQQAGLGFRHRPVRIDGLTLQALSSLHALAANKSHRPGRPLSSNAPRSSNFRAAYEIRDYAGYEDFLGPGICHYPGRGVDRDATDIAAPDLDFSSVQTRTQE